MYFGDPDAEFDLLSQDALPQNPDWVSFVAKYKCKDAVRCMRPGCGQPHNEGAVVEIKSIDQTIGMINIGHDCGEQLFPEQYLAGGTSYDADIERKDLIIKKRHILSRAHSIRRWFENVAKPFREYDDARRSFEAFMPDLLDAIRSAFRSRDGVLAIDHASSGKAFREALAAEGIKSPAGREWLMVHRVTGRHFYSNGELVERAAKAAAECDELLERLHPDDLSVAHMRECINRLGNIGERMQRMERQYRDMFSALSAENLRGLANWSRRDDADSPYEFKGDGLMRNADGRLPHFFLRVKAGSDQQSIDMFPISQAA
jgi:hypothetical protein